MKFDEWLTTIPIQQTPQGARLDLRLYICPDGHGNLCVDNENSRSRGELQPIKNPAEAREVLEKLWARAMRLNSESRPAEPCLGTIADQFADVIGTVPDLPEDMASQHDHYLHRKPKS